MKILLNYLCLEYKRCGKVLIKSIGSLFSMLILTVAGVSACSYVLLQTQLFPKVDVAVVIPGEEEETRLIARYVSSMDSVESVCNFHYLTFRVAMEKLEENQVQAVLAFPEHFYEDIYVGRNTPATVYFPKQSELNGKVFQELFLDGVSMLQISEAGVYASLYTAWDKETIIERENVAEHIAGIYVKTVLGRDKVFDKYTESPLGTLNVYQYYLAALFTVFLLLSGLNFGFLYQKQGKSLEEKLRMYGIRQGKTAAVKITVMTMSLWTMGVLLYVLFCLLTGFVSEAGVWFAPEAVAALFFFSLSMASYFHIVYAVGGGGLQGTVLLLALNIGMLLCSGTVVPQAYLPEMAARAGEILPLSFWNHYSIQILFGETGVKGILTALGFVAAGIGTGVVMEWKNI